MQQGVGGEFADDQFDIVDQVRQQVLNEMEADKVARSWNAAGVEPPA